MRIDDDDDISKHLLSSIHTETKKEDLMSNWQIRDDEGLLRGLKSKAEYYYRSGDAADGSSLNEKSHELLSPHSGSRNSMKFAVIRSIMEEHAKT